MPASDGASGYDTQYAGSDWDAAGLTEGQHGKATSTITTRGNKHGHRVGSKPATGSPSSKKSSQKKRAQPLKALRKAPSRANAKPHRRRRHGSKWELTKDGRYQYLYDSDETVSGNEDRNPLWDLLGMDRQGRLIQPLADSSTSSDETASDDDIDAPPLSNVPAAAHAQSLLVNERVKVAPTLPVSNIRSAVPSSLQEVSKARSPFHDDQSHLLAQKSASSSDLDLSPDESRKRKAATKRRRVDKATPIPQSAAKRHADGLPREDDEAQSLRRPAWWSADALEGLPEDRLAPRPNLPCSEEVKNNTAPLMLGTDRGGNTIQVPRTINRFLRDYQKDGIRFLFSCYLEQRGGILGDDMGLGKTCQTISFLAAIMQKTGLGQLDRFRRATAVEAKKPAPWPTGLIICPSSVVENWGRELELWGWFEWTVMDSRNMKTTLADFEQGRLDVVIATHDFIALHIEELRDKNFSCIIVDEVHRVKNAGSVRTMAFKSFRCQVRFGLTGTAVQNDFMELHTLLDWACPGRVGNSRQWARTIDLPLQRLLDKDQTDVATHDEQLLRMALVQHLLPKFYLRRDKRIIAHQLPVKRDHLLFCSLTDEQVEAYNKLLHFLHVKNAQVADQPCGCGRQHPRKKRPLKTKECCWPLQDQKRLLMWITILKQASDHLALLYHDPEDSRPQDPVKYGRYLKQREICKVMYPSDWASKQSNLSTGLRSELCGKWRVLRQRLQEWKQAGDKVLIFTQSIRLLGWLTELVQFAGLVHRRLDGTTPQGLRQTYVDEFNTNPDINVFLISTMAGGVGLNLTAANKVVVFDPHWNPAVDEQAQDRAYRIGQARDVDIYRLIASGSLEERIFRRQVHKQQLAKLAYGDELQQRFFSGMKSVQDQEGNLWGRANLFTFEPRTVPAKGLIEDVDLQEVKAVAADLERVSHAPKPPSSTATGLKQGKARRSKDKSSVHDEEHELKIHVESNETLVADSDTASDDESSKTASRSPTLKHNDAALDDSADGQTRTLRHDLLFPPAVQIPKQRLRRLDDVATIFHEGSTILVGRPGHLRPGSAPQKVEATTGKHTQLPAPSHQPSATSNAGAGTSMPTLPREESDGQVKSQPQQQVRWQPAPPERRFGSAAPRKQHRIARF